MSAALSLWSGLRCNGRNMCQGYEERPPYVWENGCSNGNVKSLEEAIRVMTLILRQDTLGEGQRVDLTYVREVLKCVEDDLHADKEEQDLVAIMKNDALDERTQAWLLGFSGKVDKAHKLRDVVNAVRMAIRMKQKLSKTRPRETTAGPSEPDLQGLMTWGGFDVFEYEREFPGMALRRVAFRIMEGRGILESFQLSKTMVQTFLAELEKSYINNPYHNAIHAADVTHGVHILLNKGMDKGLSDLEVFAVIFAAACHDVGHMGLTNDFLVKTSSDVALTYNDRSVNENMHLAIAYRILQRSDCSFLQHAFTPKQRESMRKMVVESVLATDMAQHFSSVSALNKTVQERGTDVGKWDSTALLLEMCLHGADLSNTAKPQHIALQWTDRVLKEFFLQGDQERRLGREVSPMCDRSSVSKAGSQVGFMDFIVRPMLQAITPLCDTQELMANLSQYHLHWSTEQQNEKRKKSRRSCGSGASRL
mmetsp:Transcript_15224/g.47340  ORF Transcript_15224/g.47340 Transcript_15224/m.47340 type:complete len:479 (-) Transcript_15224:52-1488(-)